MIFAIVSGKVSTLKFFFCLTLLHFDWVPLLPKH